jgi:hypothetical protein
MNLKKLSASVAAAAMTAAFFAPSVMAADLEISGNGYASKNTIQVYEKCVTKLSQSNTTVANTFVKASAETGDNSVSKNTGGDSDLVTGDATTMVGVKVMGGDNYAEAPSCCDCKDDSDVLISGNGAKSKNSVKQSSFNMTLLSQKSKTLANTKVFAGSDTGGNKVDKNTGGSSSLKTGDAFTSVKVKVFGGSNLMY